MTASSGEAPRLICLGLAALDWIWHVAELPAAGKKARATAFEEAGGGMAATAAVTAARLGAHVALWSRVGEDSAGEAIRAGLAREGVDIANVRRFPGALSSASGVYSSMRRVSGSLPISAARTCLPIRPGCR